MPGAKTEPVLEGAPAPPRRGAPGPRLGGTQKPIFPDFKDGPARPGRDPGASSMVVFARQRPADGLRRPAPRPSWRCRSSSRLKRAKAPEPPVGVWGSEGCAQPPLGTAGSLEALAHNSSRSNPGGAPIVLERFRGCRRAKRKPRGRAGTSRSLCCAGLTVQPRGGGAALGAAADGFHPNLGENFLVLGGGPAIGGSGPVGSAFRPPRSRAGSPVSAAGPQKNAAASRPATGACNVTLQLNSLNWTKRRGAAGRWHSGRPRSRDAKGAGAARAASDAAGGARAQGREGWRSEAARAAGRARPLAPSPSERLGVPWAGPPRGWAMPRAARAAAGSPTCGAQGPGKAPRPTAGRVDPCQFRRSRAAPKRQASNVLRDRQLQPSQGKSLELPAAFQPPSRRGGRSDRWWSTPTVRAMAARGYRLALEGRLRGGGRARAAQHPADPRPVDGRPLRWCFSSNPLRGRRRMGSRCSRFAQAPRGQQNRRTRPGPRRQGWLWQGVTPRRARAIHLALAQDLGRRTSATSDSSASGLPERNRRAESSAREEGPRESSASSRHLEPMVVNLWGKRRARRAAG